MIQHSKNGYINVSSLSSLADFGISRASVAIGVFDGVHIGHQQLLKELIKMTDQNHSEPVALTFFPHPRTILRPDSPPSLILPPFKKIELLHQCGIKAVVTIPFTKEFSMFKPEDFVKYSLITREVELTGICVGRNWRFGSGGAGNSEKLRELAQKKHFDFIAVDEITLDDHKVSSSNIRRSISSGLLEDAAKMLGRPYSLSGIVEKGKRVAGPQLTFPTANLKIDFGILPPNGVYAGSVKFSKKVYPAAIAIGLSPTFNYAENKTPRVEVHLIGFKGDIYGSQIEAELFSYLREERCYSSPEELKKQITSDIANVSEIFNGIMQRK
ncbi:MAG: riboflavin biosynthesis protein RibF [Lentisphaerae bacterium GWF2_45_14]|nr:MAG: riboflavin biosynthesis protein RibF [Lentisphaerae bacterium GWF2_45_14]